ncbi:hypothetical protein GCM10017044_07850 [Kordiimonas sediminis]|uniref:SHSP domain-containing protein n=1 Tax=Kordiimonas sediminis TaxID=1735581 RepID=A0A919ANV3_9PROT|nr:Hsp20 family protein [Kordiimonas sediminis]GHF16013.1 hypothetical protein GCM10017044_07850 [Kordiimonas sediminis]
MTRQTHFNNPLLLGFDELASILDSVGKGASEGYPPYNIEHVGTDVIRISLAVAGFTTDDLEVIHEGNQLSVKGKVPAQDKEREYLHRGIAARQFLRKFVLADNMEVVDAYLENGLLNLDVKKPKPEEHRKVITIR